MMSTLGHWLKTFTLWKVYLPISLIWVFLVSAYLMALKQGMLQW